jgi:hypothetical protein
MATAAADDDAMLDAISGTNRRTRMTITADPQVKAWLRRTASCHAHLCYIVRLFGKPETAGGQSLQGEDFAARAAAGDRSLIFDALTFLGDQIADLRHEIANEMANTPATTAIPGSAEKVAVMFARAEAGYDLFIDGDAKVDVS